MPSSQERIEERRRIAAKAADRRRRIRRTWQGAIVVVLVVAGGALVYARRDSGSSTSTTSTTSTTLAAGSVKGQPCVALADPLPTGAPNVPITPGPAPASLVSTDITPGTGATVAASSTLTVNYIGVACSTGKIFDSTWSRGQTAQFPLAQVIPGWQQGLVGMKVGGERLLAIPSDLAYGPTGRPPTIAPDEALFFVVDLVDSK